MFHKKKRRGSWSGRAEGGGADDGDDNDEKIWNRIFLLVLIGNSVEIYFALSLSEIAVNCVQVSISGLLR